MPSMLSSKRWVMPIYMNVLHGNMVKLTGRDRKRFVSHTRRAAGDLNDKAVGTLLASEWQARISAGWLIGVARRPEFVDRLGPLLVESQLVYAGQGYCFAMAANPSEESAEWLVRCLDRWLPETDLYYDQTWAMGALLVVDRQLGSQFAEQYLGDGAAWERWLGAESTTTNGIRIPKLAERGFTPEVELIDAMLVIADECRQ